ncbi:hypothetical protein ADL29_28410 [Streptomyces chattanoogensis]|uniref:Uncharacterized protein n=1 Tax=Streptomyces chattanoogensis TaxID=66876 RepID=A0A0N0GX49_9ACTN|nr:hypothetical protein ADL29_28410 [Streptomyces chattanoogensis]
MLSHEVLGMDLGIDKVHTLSSGKAPFFERDLDELLAKHTASGRLRWVMVGTSADCCPCQRAEGRYRLMPGPPHRPAMKPPGPSPAPLELDALRTQRDLLLFLLIALTLGGGGEPARNGPLPDFHLAADGSAAESANRLLGTPAGRLHAGLGRRAHGTGSAAVSCNAGVTCQIHVAGPSGIHSS